MGTSSPDAFTIETFRGFMRLLRAGTGGLARYPHLHGAITVSREEFEEFLDGTIEAREIDRTGHAADASLIRVLP